MCYTMDPESDPILFNEYLFEPILALQNDKVSNVRCLLSRFLAEAPEWVYTDSKVLTGAERLCVDEDVDVRWFIGYHGRTTFNELYLKLESDGSVAKAEARRRDRKISNLAEDDVAKSKLDVDGLIPPLQIMSLKAAAGAGPFLSDVGM